MVPIKQILVVQQIFEFIQDIKGKALQMLTVTMLVLSSEDACKRVNLSTCELFLVLPSNLEEAATKMITHSFHALQLATFNQVDHPGDTHVLVLEVNLLNNDKEMLFIDHRCSIKRTLH